MEKQVAAKMTIKNFIMCDVLVRAGVIAKHHASVPNVGIYANHKNFPSFLSRRVTLEK
jgi:hypothetical protein